MKHLGKQPLSTEAFQQTLGGFQLRPSATAGRCCFNGLARKLFRGRTLYSGSLFGSAEKKVCLESVLVVEVSPRKSYKKEIRKLSSL